MISLETIRQAWSWIGLEPAEVIATNAFGNLIVRATDDAIWRICPEELSCKQIARDRSDYARMASDPDFQADWEFLPVVRAAEQWLGRLPDGKCYYLFLPAVFGGAFDKSNIRVNSLDELIRHSGDMAWQIKDLPDGTPLEIRPRPAPQ